MKSIKDKAVFNNGYKMPFFAIGPSIEDGSQTVAAWDVSGKTETIDSSLPSFNDVFETAIHAGFRSFDSGARYGTEEPLGRLFRNCSIPRSELYLTTKVNNVMQGYDNTMKDFENSLKKTGLDYIDLYLIHCPIPMKGLYLDTWRAMENIYHSGRVKAIGVSNFTVQQLYDLSDISDIVPVLNQREQHPFYVQPNLIAYERRHGILAESYSPLGQGKFAYDPRIQWIADNHHKSIAQVILRWHIQKGFMLVSRSTKLKRIKENADIFDFELDADEMAFMQTLNHGNRIWHDPDRFPGTAAHIHVEEVLRENINMNVDRKNISEKKKEEILQNIDSLLDYEDVDGTRDYVMYCFFRAANRYGRSSLIEEQACDEAVLVAAEIVSRLFRGEDVL